MTTRQRRKEQRRLAELERALAEAAEDAYEEARYSHRPRPQTRDFRPVERPARLMGRHMQEMQHQPPETGMLARRTRHAQD